MSSTDVTLRERGDQRLDVAQVQYIANTEFVPRHYRSNLPAIMACLAYGRELGLGDMESLRSIAIIDGKPSLGAETMVRLVRYRGHSITGRFGDGEVTAVGTRADNKDSIEVTWTMGMAERAGLLGKDNWKRYPESMLWARAVSQLCRMLFADCLAGLIYTEDEVELEGAEKVAEALSGAQVPHEAADEPDDGQWESVVSSTTTDEPVDFAAEPTDPVDDGLTVIDLARGEPDPEVAAIDFGPEAPHSEVVDETEKS